MQPLTICHPSTSKGTGRGIEADVLRPSVGRRRRQQGASIFRRLESEIWEKEDFAALQRFNSTGFYRLGEGFPPTAYLDGLQRRQGETPRNSVVAL
jgi:hypothetical protein